MKVSSIACIALLLAVTALSCGGVKGEFGFKRFGDDTYHQSTDAGILSDEEVARYLSSRRSTASGTSALYARKRRWSGSM